MKNNEILKRILSCLGCNESAQTTFIFDEVVTWFNDIADIDVFVKNEILQKLSSTSKTIECNECGQKQCAKKVTTIKNKKQLKTRIFCGENDNIGYVDIDQQRLQQWQISGILLAKTLSKLLELKLSPEKNKNSNSWALGTLKGKKNEDCLILSIKDGVFLKIAGYTIPLIDVLEFKNTNLFIDKIFLLRKVDNPKEQVYATTETKKMRIKERDKQIMNEYYKRKIESPHSYDTTIAGDIAEMPQFQIKDKTSTKTSIPPSTILRIINRRKGKDANKKTKNFRQKGKMDYA